jgi:ribosome assembly protein 1
LREKFAKIRIQPSEPIVAYRETCIIAPAFGLDDSGELDPGTVIVTASAKTCSIGIRAIPLPQAVRTFLMQSEERLQALDVSANLEERAAFIVELRAAFAEAKTDGELAELKVDWEPLLSNIVAFGPKKVGSNILVNQIQGAQWQRWIDPADARSEEYTSSIFSAFQMATMAGPLCAEPIAGVCFSVESFERTDDCTLANQVRTTLPCAASSLHLYVKA